MKTSLEEKLIVGFRPFLTAILLAYKMHAEGADNPHNLAWQIISAMRFIGLSALGIGLLFLAVVFAFAAHPLAIETDKSSNSNSLSPEQIKSAEEAAELRHKERVEEERLRTLERQRKEEEVATRAKETERKKLESKRNRTHLEALEEALEEF